jgi:hypothetical protein
VEGVVGHRPDAAGNADDPREEIGGGVLVEKLRPLLCVSVQDPSAFWVSLLALVKPPVGK